MTVQAQTWIGTRNTRTVRTVPFVMFGNVAVGLGAAASANIQPGEFGLPPSDHWLIASAVHVSWVLRADNAAGGLVTIYLSGDGATGTFTAWQSYTINGTPNVTVQTNLPVAGWAMQIQITNSAGVLQNFTGLFRIQSVV